MKASFEMKRTFICLLAIVVLCARAQDATDSKPSP